MMHKAYIYYNGKLIYTIIGMHSQTRTELLEQVRNNTSVSINSPTIRFNGLKLSPRTDEKIDSKLPTE